MEKLRWLVHDLRFALRGLNRDRKFAALAVFALALGIGATTVIFSIIYNGVLNPFPYRDANRLAVFTVHNLVQSTYDDRMAYTMPEFLDYRKQNHVFEDMIGRSYEQVLYTHEDETEAITVVELTPNAFEFLGVPPLLGRPVVPQDGEPGAPPVLAMNYNFWKKEFNGDPNVIGKSVTLNGRQRTVVAVMPQRFQLDGQAAFWAPISFSPGETGINGNTRPQGHPLFVTPLARLKRGVSVQAASADLDLIGKGLATVYPKGYPKQFTVPATTLVEAVIQDFKSMLYILIGAVTMLLLIACSNVANLLLARATAREKELAIRVSFGASRVRLIGQLLVESFLLAAAGGVCGCLLAYGGVQWVIAAKPAHSWIPDEAVLSLNLPVLLFALCVTFVTTLLCGLVPALRAVRNDPQSQLAGSSKGAGSGSGFRHGKVRAALVVVEVALSIVLLAGAGLMMRSFLILLHVDLGFEPKNILVAFLATPKGKYDKPQQSKMFYQEILRQVAALPGVVSAARTIALPPFGGPVSEVVVPGTAHSDTWSAEFDTCSEGIFATMDMHLLRGRLLTADDIDGARQIAVVNQTLVRKFFGKEDPIGRTIHFNFLDMIPNTPHNAYFEIVGVVSDLHNNGVQAKVIPQAYLPYTVAGVPYGTIIVKTAVPPDSLLPSLHHAVWAVDRDIALTDSGSLERFMHEYSYALPQFGLVALGAFAAVGLLLAIIGVYSVMAYTVTLQTHEIGIRMALGAQRGEILAMVLRKGLLLISAGLIAGLAASFALKRFVASQIWGVSAADPWTYIAVVVIMLTVGLIACLSPARRAVKVDPLVALRYE